MRLLGIPSVQCYAMHRCGGRPGTANDYVGHSRCVRDNSFVLYGECYAVGRSSSRVVFVVLSQEWFDRAKNGRDHFVRLICSRRTPILAPMFGCPLPFRPSRLPTDRPELFIG